MQDAASTWMGRYSYGHDDEVTPALKLNGSKLLNSVHQVMIGNTRTLSPTRAQRVPLRVQLLLQHVRPRAGVRARRRVRAWHSRHHVPDRRSRGAFRPSSSPGTTASETARRVLTPTGTRCSSSSTTCPGSAARTRSSWAERIRFDQFNQDGNQFSRGSFQFDGRATGSFTGAATPGAAAFADFLLGYQRLSEAAVALATTRFRAISQSYYFNDTWRMRGNMTLDYGLRYEYTPPWLDKGGTLMNAYLPYQRPGAARRGPVASSRAHPDRLRRLLRGAECPIQSEHPGRPRRHPGRTSDRRRQVEFRSAGRMGLDAQRRLVGPGRRGHLLHARHRQSAVRHGAKRGRAPSGHVRPAAVESELERAVCRVGHESLQRAAAHWSASRSTTCSATCTTARRRT